MDWILATATLISAVAAVLAWGAKLRWSKEYMAATEQMVRAKDAQIAGLVQEVDHLRQDSSVKVREHYLAVRKGLEDVVVQLEAEVRSARQLADTKDTELANLRHAGTSVAETLSRLQEERDELSKATDELSGQLNSLRRRYEGDDVLVLRIPRIDMSFVQQVQDSARRLTEAMARDLEAMSRDLMFRDWSSVSEALKKAAEVNIELKALGTAGREGTLRLRGQHEEDPKPDV